MFTGIVKNKGKIEKIVKKNGRTFITISATNILKNKKIGQSVSVNGACLTIKKISGKKAEFEIMEKTLTATNFKNLKKEDTVNLEPAMVLGESFDGHIVQGHIDCTGKILDMQKEKSQKILRISFHKKYSKLLRQKGSIAVNGVSLTISKLGKSFFEVCLVAHTLKTTNL